MGDPPAPLPMTKSTFLPLSSSTTPPTGDGGRRPPVRTTARSLAFFVPSLLRSSAAVPVRKFTAYARATPRFTEQTPTDPAAADGWLVEKNVVPAMESGALITFSPAASARYHPLAAFTGVPAVTRSVGVIATMPVASLPTNVAFSV